MKLPFFEWILNFGKYKIEPLKNIPMTISPTGIELIKKYEGFISEPYLDAVGVPTIGYGATYYPNGRKVTMNDKPISKWEAEVLLKDMTKDFEKGVNKSVTSKINQNQFDALVSFSYNLGNGALAKSTLLKRVNANPNDPDIRNQFMRWTKAGGRELAGLVRRRKEEADLYFTEI